MPLGIRGIVATPTKAEGSIQAGNRSARKRRRPAASGRVPDHVGDQALATARSVRDRYGRVRHLGVRPEGGLDLARLDPEAADLDLLVPTAEELDRAVGAAPHDVAGAVRRAPAVPSNGSGTKRSAVSSGRRQ